MGPSVRRWPHKFTLLSLSLFVCAQSSKPCPVNQTRLYHITSSWADTICFALRAYNMQQGVAGCKIIALAFIISPIQSTESACTCTRAAPVIVITINLVSDYWCKNLLDYSVHCCGESLIMQQLLRRVISHQNELLYQRALVFFFLLKDHLRWR